MAHRIRELINKAPDHTVDVKKGLVAEVGVNRDTVNRWYTNSDIKIDSEKALKILSFFQKYWPEMKLEDLFTEDSIAADHGLV
jgi:hypothetical protein